MKNYAIPSLLGVAVLGLSALALFLVAESNRLSQQIASTVDRLSAIPELQRQVNELQDGMEREQKRMNTILEDLSEQLSMIDGEIDIALQWRVKMDELRNDFDHAQEQMNIHVHELREAIATPNGHFDSLTVNSLSVVNADGKPFISLENRQGWGRIFMSDVEGSGPSIELSAGPSATIVWSNVPKAGGGYWGLLSTTGAEMTFGDAVHENPLGLSAGLLVSQHGGKTFTLGVDRDGAWIDQPGSEVKLPKIGDAEENRDRNARQIHPGMTGTVRVDHVLRNMPEGFPAAALFLWDTPQSLRRAVQLEEAGDSEGIRRLSTRMYVGGEKWSFRVISARQEGDLWLCELRVTSEVVGGPAVVAQTNVAAWTFLEPSLVDWDD